MKDYISKEAEQYIEVGFSPIIAKNAKKIIEHFKPIIEPLNQRPDIGQNITPYFGGMLLMMYENDLYDWHFDGMDYSKNKELPKIGSNYVYLYYLTKGSPLDIGGWTTINRNFNTLNLNPDILLATIYPKPGKTLKFPPFLAHRVRTTSIERWVLRKTEPATDGKLKQLWINYFFKDKFKRQKIENNKKMGNTVS